MAEVLAPAREAVAGILERGQRDAVLEAVNIGALEDDGHRIAVATLIAAGVPEKRAAAVVEEVATEMRAASTDDD